MPITDRKYFYDRVEANGNMELDYLSYSFTEMELDTITTFRIPHIMQNRPDLISKKFFNNFDFGWLLAHHNDFLDPILDFRRGRVIDIPDIDQYFRYYKSVTRSA